MLSREGDVGAWVLLCLPKAAQDARQSIAAYKFCCQSINLKMAIRAETCS